MENAIYGGRVDNQFDMRVLTAYLKQHFHPDVISGSGRAKRQLSDEINMPTSNEAKVI